jgi:hypothetical protein
LFLQQAAMTRVVEQYNSINSVYGNNYGNPIHKAIASIATELNLIVDGKAIDKYTKYTSILKALKANPNIQKGFRELFGAEISTKNSLDEVTYAINLKLLENRYNYPTTYNISWNEQENEKYKQVAFDIATILTFEKLRNITGSIESLAQVSNPDKFGAKQTIRSTRNVVDTIKKYAKEKEGTIAKTIRVGDGSFIDALFPGIETGTINIDESRYKYMAAFLEHATQFSIKVGSKLLTMESNTFNTIVNSIEESLGIKFTDEQYKEYKQYMVAYSYASVPLFTTPYVITEDGHFARDIETIEENENVNNRFWNVERNRIFGYNTTESVNLKIENVNNPTKEELKQFNALTPAQKVVWLKTNYTHSSGIFGNLKVSMFNQKRAASNGFTSQTIRYSDQIEDQEGMYNQFKLAFFNKNPLVRSAALDLIKYAFVVEGFKFKKGAISKIIPVDVLLANEQDFGLDVVSNIVKQFMLYADFSYTSTEEFKNIYVRSHSDIVTTKKVPKVGRLGRPTDGDLMARNFNYYGLTFIPFSNDEDSKKTLKFLTINEGTPKQYIKLVVPNIGTILYRMRNIQGKGVYIYPVNLLESNEVTEYSVNNNNNKFYTEDYYVDIINESIGTNETVETVANREEFKVDRNTQVIPRFKSTHVNEALVNMVRQRRVRLPALPLQSKAKK